MDNIGRYGLVVERGITEIGWQLICRILRMRGFRMLMPRDRHSCLIVFDSYSEAMEALNRLNA